MNEHDLEIDRCRAILKDLEARANPTPELLDLIDYYRNQITERSRLADVHFQPYRDTFGVLVINRHGDTENDL